MKRFACALLLAAAPFPLFAQSGATQTQLEAIASALRDSALTDNYAWDIAEALTTEVGPRLAGTEAEARARDWAMRKLAGMGFANVRVETFDMATWVRGEEKAWVTAPFPQPLVITALGNSGATPPQGITAEVVGYDTMDEFESAPPEEVRGKIVFVSHAMQRTQDGSHYGAFGTARRNGPTLASKRGAAAIVIRSIGTDYHRNPHTGVQTFADGTPPIPAGALSIPDAEQLQRILRRAPGPVQVRLVITPRNIGMRPSGNVIAEVPGRDRAAPPIVAACHLDSWDQGTGAVDDAAGCGIVAAAAKRIMDAGRPQRTIRIVWFGAEEVGLLGGEDYHKRHGAEPHHALAESDFGAGRIWKVDSRLGPSREAEAKALQRVLAPLGVSAGVLDKAEGSDISVMLTAGHPGVTLNQDGTKYFDVHHSPDDTLDKIDLGDLRQNVAAWTAMLAVLSGGIEPAAKPSRGKRR
jgi:carboxypeptidase Q